MSSLTLVGKAFPCRLNEFISYSLNFETWGLKFAPNFQIWKRNWEVGNELPDRALKSVLKPTVKLNDNTYFLKTINVTCHAKDSQFPIFSIYFPTIRHSCLHRNVG